MANEVIREAAKKAGVKLWEVAECCGIGDSTFSRQLRRELPSDRQKEILEMIQKIAAEKEATT